MKQKRIESTAAKPDPRGNRCKCVSLTVPARGKICDGGLTGGGGGGGGGSSVAAAVEVKEKEEGGGAGPSSTSPAAAAAAPNKKVDDDAEEEEEEGAKAAATAHPKGKGKGKGKARKTESPPPPLRCDHSGTVHYSWWNKHVANPIRESGYGGGGAASMRLLRGTILEACMLRRTK